MRLKMGVLLLGWKKNSLCRGLIVGGQCNSICCTSGVEQRECEETDINVSAVLSDRDNNNRQARERDGE